MNQTFEYIFSKPVEFGTDVIISIPQDGDYIDQLLVRAIIPGTFFLNLVERFELIIDGNVIERHYSETINFMNELYVPTGKRPGLLELTGPGNTVIIPISFRVPLLAAPQLRVVLKDSNSSLDLRLIVEYSYFETLPSTPLTFLVHTFQRLEFTCEAKQVTLNTQFQNNVKELFWTTSQGGTLIDNIESIELTLSNEILLNSFYASGMFFKTLQPLVHHTRVPTIPFYMYSFSIDPESTDPTGEVQMSDITVQRHLVTFKDKVPLTIRVYALSTTRMVINPDGTSRLAANTQEKGFINIVSL
jgi:hypothetical protein